MAMEQCEEVKLTHTDISALMVLARAYLAETHDVQTKGANDFRDNVKDCFYALSNALEKIQRKKGTDDAKFKKLQREGSKIEEDEVE